MSVNKRAVDRLISYYANVPLGPKPYWPTSCFGYSLLQMGASAEGRGFVEMISEELGIDHAKADSLFFLQPQGTSKDRMDVFHQHKDPAGYIIGILEHLRDTGEVVIPTA